MRGNFNEEIDKKIIDCLNYKTEKILVPDNMLYKIRTDIRNYKSGNTADTKNGFFRVKLIIVVGILTIVMAMPVVAHKKNLHWFNKEGDIKTIVNQLPSVDVVEKTLGYLPKYQENLHSKFKFKSFNVFDKYAQDVAGNKIVNTKEGEFEYIQDETDKNKYLKMTVTKVEKEYFDEKVKNIIKSFSYYESSNNMMILGSYIVQKKVPDDYVETKDDVKSMKDGSMDLIFGANRVDIYSVKCVLWYEDGIEYKLINKGYNDIQLYEMVHMAEYIRVNP